MSTETVTHCARIKLAIQTDTLAYEAWEDLWPQLTCIGITFEKFEAAVEAWVNAGFTMITDATKSEETTK